MSLRVLKQGVFDSIQDSGRYGHQHLGINPSGAMDIIAAGITNSLAGNNFDEAVIELHFPASSFLFNEDGLIALSGADFAASLNEQEIPINASIVVKKNSVLQFNKIKNGARCYLAVNGGFEITEWLNSYSTNLKAKVGGFKGRCLKKDDEMEFKKKTDYSSVLREKTFVLLLQKDDVASFYSSSNIIRICEGPEYYQLTDSSKQYLTSTSFSITTQSDRMGFRMTGEPLKLQTQIELVSSAVIEGTIQLFPDGQFIILMADHQTTGGYPRIANVISADIPKLSQLFPGAEINFQMVSVEEAEELLINQVEKLNSFKNEIASHLKPFLHHAHR
ncbi:MAG: biotin-dependent carboxyltransferase family protein [Chitinophagales bacterium]